MVLVVLVVLVVVPPCLHLFFSMQFQNKMRMQIDLIHSIQLYICSSFLFIGMYMINFFSFHAVIYISYIGTV